jgi:hypothetical protein
LGQDGGYFWIFDGNCSWNKHHVSTVDEVVLKCSEAGTILLLLLPVVCDSTTRRTPRRYKRREGVCGCFVFAVRVNTVSLALNVLVVVCG